MKRREEFYNNTLFNEIIRIDFLRIKNIENILDNLRNLMKKNKYSFRTTDIRNVNINIEDPETLETQEMIKSNINTTKNYEYVSLDECNKFVLNEYFLIFEKNNFSKYEKLDEYLKLINKIIDVIIDNESGISVSRVGIRKMNHLFVSDVETLKKYININIPNKDDIEILDEYAIVQKNLDNTGGYSSNIVLNLKKGKLKTDSIKEMPMYRFIWDIDCYIRKIENTEIESKMSSLNEYLFKRYDSIITDDFSKILQDKELKLEDLERVNNIYGGINKND